jgi:hypothetical protein
MLREARETTTTLIYKIRSEITLVRDGGQLNVKTSYVYIAMLLSSQLNCCL